MCILRCLKSISPPPPKPYPHPSSGALPAHPNNWHTIQGEGSECTQWSIFISKWEFAAFFYDRWMVGILPVFYCCLHCIPGTEDNSLLTPESWILLSWDKEASHEAHMYIPVFCYKCASREAYLSYLRPIKLSWVKWELSSVPAIQCECQISPHDVGLNHYI